MASVVPMEHTDSSSSSLMPKLEPLPDGYGSTPESSPEAEAEAPAQSDAPPVVKRKGGRKPIYATSEERKQRNRQAQAAFRERRTEYIKQLEETIKQQETTLQNLQQSHRTAADECLMLRYKNSLLERILLEKGIDVQAELRMKGSPAASASSRVSASSCTSQVSPMQRAMMNRQQQARVNPNVPSLARQNTNPSSSSPSIHATPSSQHSSPSTGKSPGYVVQGGISPTTSDGQAQQQMQPRPQQQSSFIHHQNMPRPPPSSQPYHPASSNMQTGYYPPSFQKHYDQLEQEYAHDAQQADMIEGRQDHGSSAPSSEMENYTPRQQHYGNVPPHQRGPPGSQPTGSIGMQGQPPHPQHDQNMMRQGTSDPNSHNTFAHGPGHPLFDPFDPMLDADPFGLTASMHFPTPFTYDQQQGQQGGPSSR